MTPLIIRSVENIFSPLGILSLLMIGGILLIFSRRFRRTGRFLLFCGALLFAIFLFSPLSKYLILGLERPYPPLLVPPESPKIERIAILAGYAEDNPGIPITSNVSEQTACRLSEGLRLYRLLPGSKLIVSGGVLREGDRPVAALMAEYLQEMGVPAEDLIVEGNSQNTYENLWEVREIVGHDPFILVAPGCDMRRVIAVAQKLQMNPIPAPACIWTLQNYTANMKASEWIADFFSSFAYPSTENLVRLQWAYHEYAGYIWYRLLNRI